MPVTFLPSRRGHFRVVLTVVLLISSLGLLGWGLTGARAARVVADLTALGPGVIFILLFHLAVIACTGAAWALLLRGRTSAPPHLFFWARWLRDAANRLLPAGKIGGEIAGLRLLTLHGMSAAQAGASVVLDTLAEALSQVPFTLLGLALFFGLHGARTTGEAIALGLAAAMLGAAATLVAWQAGWLTPLIEKMRARGGKLLVALTGWSGALRALYRRDLFLAACGVHLLAWILGTGEVWLALKLMHHPIGLGEALALESLSQAVSSLGFLVPASLGVQEGAYLAIGVALGLPLSTALALAVVKRLRQILMGVPALMSWQALELRGLARSRRARRRRRITPPANNADPSDSNSYLRRAMRTALKPFARTALRPNHITGLRIATGAAACLALARGTIAADRWAALLWMVSALLDRGDGEFARLTGRCSRFGHKLDCAGDVALNALIFLALGLNLQQSGWGDPALPLGLWTCGAIAVAALLAETLENRIGRKTVPSRGGFDFDDATLLLGPAIWFGLLAPLLIGAALGGTAILLYLSSRLAGLSGRPVAPVLVPVRSVPVARDPMRRG